MKIELDRKLILESYYQQQVDKHTGDLENNVMWEKRYHDTKKDILRKDNPGEVLHQSQRYQDWEKGILDTHQRKISHAEDLLKKQQDTSERNKKIYVNKDYVPLEDSQPTKQDLINVGAPIVDKHIQPIKDIINTRKIPQPPRGFSQNERTMINKYIKGQQK